MYCVYRVYCYILSILYVLYVLCVLYVVIHFGVFTGALCWQLHNRQEAQWLRNSVIIEIDNVNSIVLNTIITEMKTTTWSAVCSVYLGSMYMVYTVPTYTYLLIRTCTFLT